MHKSKPAFTKKFKAPSRDGRTNLWTLTCTCGKSWVPSSTMLARRHEQCPKCGKSEEVNYNADT